MVPPGNGAVRRRRCNDERLESGILDVRTPRQASGYTTQLETFAPGRSVNVYRATLREIVNAEVER